MRGPMTAEVVNLHPGPVGDGFKVSPDDILNCAKGKLTNLVLVGIQEDGELYIAGSEGAPQSCFLMERAKSVLVENLVYRA